LQSDCQEGNDYFQTKILTVGGAGDQIVNDTEAGGLTGHLWRSDHPGIGAGGLTDPWWRSDCQGQFHPPEKQFLLENFSKEFNWIQTFRPLRKPYGKNGGAHSEF
jgi:hypothetical protein